MAFRPRSKNVSRNLTLDSSSMMKLNITLSRRMARGRRSEPSSILRSGPAKIRVSAITGFVAALVFCGLGTPVYGRKPEDQSAFIFYLLSQMATVVAAIVPLLYVDVFAASGARPVFVFTPTQSHKRT